MMERDQVAALEHSQLLKANNEGPNNGSSLLPPSSSETMSSQIPTYSSSLAPSTLTRGIDQRKYSTGFDTRKYSSQIDPYRKYSSVSGYGGRSYLNPSAAQSSTGSTSLAYGGAGSQHVPMIDDK